MLKKIALLSLVTTNCFAYQIHNGKVIEDAHLISSSENVTHKEISSNILAQGGQDVRLGAQADDIKAKVDNFFYATTNHNVYLINHDQKSKHTYKWYMTICPETFECGSLVGVVELEPNGEFIRNERLSYQVIYRTHGFYDNKAITGTIEYKETKVQDIGIIEAH